MQNSLVKCTMTDDAKNHLKSSEEWKFDRFGDLKSVKFYSYTSKHQNKISPT